MIKNRIPCLLPNCGCGALQWLIQGCHGENPRGGDANHLFGQFFQNLHENEINWTVGASLALALQMRGGSMGP